MCVWFFNVCGLWNNFANYQSHSPTLSGHTPCDSETLRLFSCLLRVPYPVACIGHQVRVPSPHMGICNRLATWVEGRPFKVPTQGDTSWLNWRLKGLLYFFFKFSYLSRCIISFMSVHLHYILKLWIWTPLKKKNTTFSRRTIAGILVYSRYIHPLNYVCLVWWIVSLWQ